MELDISDEEVNLGVRQELHPLFNELTLAKILSNLPLQTLIQCRLVCKTWAENPEIIHRIQEQTIHLSNYETLEHFLTFLQSHSTSTLTPTLPFTQFDLGFTRQCHPLCDSSHALTEKEEAATLIGKGKLSNFLQTLQDNSFSKCKIFIKFLKLTLDKTHLDRDGLVSLLLDTPCVREHLESLYIYNLSHRAVFSVGFLPQLSEKGNYSLLKLKTLIMDEIRIAIPDFMTQFLKFCPNLEEICLKCDKRSDWQNQKGIWKEHSPLASSILKGLAQSWATNNRNLRLKIFRCGILDQTHFRLLLDLGMTGALRLTLLEIYCPAKDVSSDLLKSFLETQTSSLKVLRVLGNVDKLRRAVGNNGLGVGVQNGHGLGQGQGQPQNPPDIFVLELPQRMEALECFQLSGRDKDTPLPVQNIQYGTQFPRLNTLIVNGFATNIGERMEDYFPQGWTAKKPCLSLRKLVLPAEIRDPDFPGRVLQLFPALSVMDVKYPDNAFLTSVFTTFKELEKLKILAESGLSIEEGIIGESGDENGILSLKELKVLEITVETEHREIPTALTERVVTETLRKMQSLRKLVLLSCCWFDGLLPCNFLSQKCQEDLIKELESCVIIFSPLDESACPSEGTENSSSEIAGFYGS